MVNPDVGPRPAVDMRPSAFRTYVLNAVGAPNAAIRIAPADSVSQRVVVKHDAVGAVAFLGDSAGELETPGQLIPQLAYGLPNDEITVFVLAPHQALLAVASQAGVRLSVSTSVVVPVPERGNPMYEPMRPSSFRARTINVAGVANNVVQIVSASTRPQRVAISHNLPALAYIGCGAEASMTIGPAAGPIGNTFEIAQNQEVTFVLAPGQSLDAAGSAGGFAFRLQVHVSEISLAQVSGPSGIPGAGGEAG